MGARRLKKAVDQRVRIADRGNRDDERVEIVVIVLPFGVMMRRAQSEIVLGRRAHAEQHVRLDRALARGRDLDRARQGCGDLRAQGVEPVRADEIGLVEHDEIGAEQLVFVDLFERVVVVERWVGQALPSDSRGIVGEPSLGDGRCVHDRDDAVDRELRAQLRPVEGLDERLRQREAGGLDDDVIRLRLPRHQRRHRGGEFVGDRAADAAVGEFDDRLFRAGPPGAAFEKIAIDADVAEFVDDEGEPPPARVRQEMADQRRLAGAEKAGDDGDGRLGEHPGACL